jgi:predicted small lipoprotein YifL
MRNFLFPLMLVLAMITIAGCAGVSGPSPLPNETNPVPAETPPSPDNQIQSPHNATTTATVECTLPPKGETLTYRANITDMNKNPMSREEFLEVNREYLSYLAKEIGQEKAEQMMNDKYSRSIGPSLLDPSSGNDTRISIIIDPVGDHVAGATFNISGSTNLPPGRELTLAVFRGNYERPIPPCEDSWRDPVLRTTVVQANTSSINSWSYRLDTMGMAGDDYLIYVRESQKNAFYTNTLFHLFSRDGE